MKSKHFKGVFLTAILSAGLMLATGCRTAKERSLDTAHTSNTFLNPDALPSEAQLPPGKDAVLLTWNATDTQSQHLLQLAPEATLEKRYHRNHDLTLTCVSGSGIVEIEDTRYRLKPARSVAIPRFHSYKVLVDKDSPPFHAILVYSPPFHGKDVDITEK